ncbi:hypothetical protein KI387_003065, partial [Taxus chinensis]
MALLNVPPGTPSSPFSSEFSRTGKGFLGLTAIKHVGFIASQHSLPNLKNSRRNNSTSKKHGFSKTSVSNEDKGNDIVGDFCPLYSSHTNLTFPSTGRLHHSWPLHAANTDKNGAPPIAETKGRHAEIIRVTKETNVQVKINLDGSGISDCNTGIPFLDHMLDQIASHGIFDVEVKACGDIHIDDHHTNEDVALSFGNCLLQALGDRKGIYRFGDFSAPLDEALVHVALDLSGRPYLAYDLCIPTQRVGTYDTQLVEHFFQSLVNTSGMTLHIRQ